MKPIFKTERLQIRELNAEDWQEVFLMNTSIEVMRLIGDGKIRTEKEEQSSFTSILANYQTGTGLGVWAAVKRDDNAFIGAASMTPLGGTAEVQLGYRLKKQYWGLGYGTEIAKGLVEYGFNQLQLDQITATTNLENYASARVLEKAGLYLEKMGYYYGWPMNYFAIHNKERGLCCNG